MKQLKATYMECLGSVLPIEVLVVLLSITVSPLSSGVLVLFVFGSILLLFGMCFFSVGATLSMQPLGEGIGIRLSRSKKKLLPLLCCFFLGLAVTVAEPDLQVLANQIPSVSNLTLIVVVGIGVGLFLLLAMLRIRRKISLNLLLLIFYGIVLALACFAPGAFLPAAFDSGGVTTGPITVPFIMALGAGIAAVGDDKNGENSFGLVALCSVGPILSVLLLSLIKNPSATVSPYEITSPMSTAEAISLLGRALPETAQEVLYALLPIFAVLLVFQLMFRRYTKRELIKICLGLLYTYAGLVLFLTGAETGFIPAGYLLGAGIASSGKAVLLVPVGLCMGYFVVSAEPAVQVLKKQVEEVTGGAISQKGLSIGLSVGVGISVGIAMLRILTGLSLLPFVAAGYAVSLLISFLVPPIYTGIAFDSGGVASGPMTSTFMLPFAVGACQALGGNVLTDAFGLVAMVALAPLITIQSMGLYGNIRRRLVMRKAADEMRELPDIILCYDRPDTMQEEGNA